MPNSRLQWRALAALGALLSIIITIWQFILLSSSITYAHAMPIMNYPRNYQLSIKQHKTNINNNNNWPLFDNVTNSMSRINIIKMNQKPIHFMMKSSAATKLNDTKRTGILSSISQPKRKRKRISNETNTIIRENRIAIKNKNYHQTTILWNDKIIDSSSHRTLLVNELIYDGSTSSRTITDEPEINTTHRRHRKKILQSTYLTSTPESIKSTTNVDNVYNHRISPPTVDSNLDLPYISSTTQSVFHKTNGLTTQNALPIISNGSDILRTERNLMLSRKRSSGLERNERSANLSHITGTARKIQLLIKNRLLQLMPDGTVNGTQDDGSDYTILQRGTVDVGQIRIQGVATCLFLCMDACGNVYGAKEFTDDCIFNETMQGNYNIYSSSFHSNTQKTFYLALNKMGEPRKTHLPANKELGKLATYAKSITLTVPEDKTEKLIGRIFGSNHVKHGLKQLCDSGKSLIDLTVKKIKPKGKCGGGGGGGARKIVALKGKRPNVGVQISDSLPDKGGRKNVTKCNNNEQTMVCVKKKKINQKGALRIGNNGNNPKHKMKKQNNNRRGGGKKHRASTTTTTTKRTTTTAIIDIISTTINDNDEDFDLSDNNGLLSSTENHDRDDEWDDSTMPTIDQTAFADDDDFDEFDL